jgi:protein-tyrosine-phosphatase
MIAVMDELGIDMKKHRAQSFDDLEDTSFDIVVSLSPEAHHRALEMTRTMAIEAEYWPTLDPSIISGNREQMLDAYRQVRDGLMRKLRERFGALGARGV